MDGEFSVENLIYQLRGEAIERIALVSDEPGALAGPVQATCPGSACTTATGWMPCSANCANSRALSVLVYQQTCAAEKRRRRKRGLMDDPPKRVFINDEVCEGCGDCSRASNCLSVVPLETELGRKRKIDQSACNKDYSCVKGFCPSFVTVHGGELAKRSGVSACRPAKRSATLPEPELPAFSTHPGTPSSPASAAPAC